MIDFSTLQGLSIPEGVVTQITDASGRVLWALSGDKVILEVEKITSNTYAAETTYENEQFVLLDIYPKTNGTVSITYGGLTKTITDTSGAAEPNAQQVYFGTFNGVSDSVATPASGELTIEGDCKGFGVGSYSKSSKDLVIPYCSCITAISDFGTSEIVPKNAFYQCSKLSEVDFGKYIETIGGWAFTQTSLTSVVIPSNVKSIAIAAFSMCPKLESVVISDGVESIGLLAFSHTAITSLCIPASVKEITGHPCSGIIGNNIITVDSKNTAYKIDGNCLIEIATGYLLAGFANSVIPSYVTRIGGSAANGGDAFRGQTGLTSVTIPAGVQSICVGAFQGCTGLTEIIVLATTPPILGNAEAVGGTELTCPIIVPAGCGEVYKAAQYWADVADRIVEAS